MSISKHIRKKISVFEVLQNTNMDMNIINGGNSMITIMKDIAPIIKPFVNTLTIRKNAPLHECFSKFIWMLNSMEVKHNSVEIARNGSDGSYYIVAMYTPEFEEQVLYHMPIDVMPEFKKTNPRYHDLLMMCFSIMVNMLEINNIDSSGLYSLDMIVDDWNSWMEETEKEDQRCYEDNKRLRELKEDLKYYDRYFQKYYDEISKPVKMKDFIKTVKNEIIHTDLENRIVDFCKDIIDIVKKGKFLSQINEESIENMMTWNNGSEIYDPEEMMTLQSIVSLVWFSTSNFFHDVTEYAGEYGSNYGQVVPCIVKECYTSRSLRKFYNDTDKKDVTLNSIFRIIDKGAEIMYDINKYNYEQDRQLRFKFGDNYDDISGSSDKIHRV